MKINLNVKLVDEIGNPLMHADGKPLTMKRALIISLNNIFEDEKDISGEAKFARGMLAMRIHKEEAPDFKIDECSEIKECVGKSFSPWVIAQIWPVLEGPEEQDHIKEVK